MLFDLTIQYIDINTKYSITSKLLTRIQNIHVKIHKFSNENTWGVF